MDEIRFALSLSADEFLPYYRGEVKNVQVTALDGRRLRFPARVLIPYLGHDGIRGRFVLRYDAAGRFHSIERER